jgi:hypothetical protein
MDPRCAQNLKPAELLSLLRAHGRAAFEQAIDAPLLLVRVDDARGDLSLALEAALEDGWAASGRRPDPSLGYETGLVDVRGLSIPVPPIAFAGADLFRHLVRAVHFGIALHKRRGATNVFSERISVGRAHTNDIVLRHHSVSKFHAWFERDDDDNFYLSDARSKNATLHNGTDIAKTSPVRLTPGDEVRFGEVVTIFCPPEILWDAMMQGRAPASSRSSEPASTPRSGPFDVPVPPASGPPASGPPSSRSLTVAAPTRGGAPPEQGSGSRRGRRTSRG